MAYTLKVYYHEIQPKEGVMAHWGELGHALIRLKFSLSEFERGMSNLKDLHSILRLHHQLQNYHTSTYELAERLFSFLASLTGEASKTTKRMLKDPKQQEKALATLSKTASISIAPLKRVLRILHDDIELRHINTHKTFIRLAFNDGLEWVDIEDIWDFEDDAVAIARTFKAVGQQGMRLVKQYKSKTDHIDKNLNMFLNQIFPYLCKLMA